MRRSRLIPTIALLSTLALLTAACGQKAGVHLASTGADGSDSQGSEAVDGGGVVDAEGNPVEGGGAVDAAGNPVAGGGSGGGSGGVAGGSTTRRGGTAGGPTATTVAGGGGTPTTRVWGKTVMLGIHAPITGAAPLPSTFQKAATEIKAYFNSKANLLPGGRTIDIHIVDDEYQPATATQRCQELVKQKNAFLLLGAAGTDQIQACARYAATAGVPYLSAGVTENGLTTLKNYFAVSMSYKAQGPYLANFMKQKFPSEASDPKAVYMVYADTPNFKDAVAGFTQAFPGVKLRKVGRTPSAGELGTAASEICRDGGVSADAKKAKLVYPLMAPKDWLILLGQLPTDCRPQWSGVGVTMGINEVAGTGCQETTRSAFNGSTFFSPVPGVDIAASLDPEFRAATNNDPAKFDDIYVALWNAVKTVVDLLQRAGPDLTRAGFVKSTENATNIKTGIGPELNFSPTDHFGADQVHVLRADCSGGYNKYRTFDKFAKY